MFFKKMSEEEKEEKEMKKFYNKKLNKLLVEIVKHPSKVGNNLNKIIELMDDMVHYGVLTAEERDNELKKMNRQMMYPERFKEKIRGVIGKIRGKSIKDAKKILEEEK
jgi:hypothetical protein